MKKKYILNGKVKSCETLPGGMYVYDFAAGMPRMVDPAYQGFKIIFGREPQKTRSPSVITDCIDAVNPADGKHYSSKSRYYEALKASGSHVVEKGEHGQRRELQGDFDIRKEYRQALQQHLGR